MTRKARCRRPRTSAQPLGTGDRGQSHVVGVVLLLGLTAIALGGLTASIGAIIQDQTAHADAASVAADFDSSLRPIETTGSRRGRVTFTEGTVSTVTREIRVLDETGVRQTVDADALVYESADRRVAFLGGAIIRGQEGNAWLEREPPVTSGSDVLIVGVPRLNGSGGVSGTGGVATPIETNVTHTRHSLGDGDYSVAIETETPSAFEEYAAEQNATTTVRDLDSDGVPSVVVDFGGDRTGYVVVHDMRLEVGHG
ncbi:hypothetical protein SAMN05216559_0862 [Halomicrobium zhouii]|uniref:Flagellin N-terminal-like domain-containing protein n=1 Tax=Halomicrobium zhouii TaxID=767519 RepID=A0A1I6KIE6_9EURY|nr:type IV pilin [Halomicrobium zhouii]SFR90981.1 hypothetical protein SAMN05216559_0862 [Halomicrobium zhouii]